jgi:hypothetical protein
MVAKKHKRLSKDRFENMTMNEEATRSSFFRSQLLLS